VRFYRKFQNVVLTIDGITIVKKIPQTIPVISDAPPNIPAVDAYCGSTHL
jgi:hypothetical protein